VPELPETETIARDLDHDVAGARIIGARVTRPDILREADPLAFVRGVVGATIQHAWRRAKLIVLDLSTGDRIVVQPRFTGAMLVDAGQLPERERRYSTLELALDDGRRLHYRDIRRLGTVTLMSPARFEAYTSRLGDEPLEASFTPARLAELLHGSRQAVKKSLMDQRLVVGLGNIYAVEALWRAGIDPSRAARTLALDEVEALHGAIVGVLTESIAHRGTSFRDYRDAHGARGGFVEHLAAYGRAGGPCRRCGRTLIGTHAIDGRATVFCATCQH
jgi:formamidopyrimidine-DNA glycosylase